MKTILDKIDPQYLECAGGSCEHIEHKTNIIYWGALIAALLYFYIKRKRGVI